MNNDSKIRRYILIAEDEHAVAELLVGILEDEGYQVTRVQNGKEALEAISERRPDLLLSDVMMPLMDGLQLFQALRAHPRYESIPIILMTAARDLVVPDLGNTPPLVYKPFDLDRLLLLIHRLLAD